MKRDCQQDSVSLQMNLKRTSGGTSSPKTIYTHGTPGADDVRKSKHAHLRSYLQGTIGERGRIPPGLVGKEFYYFRIDEKPHILLYSSK
jgi:hypothetical protein